MTGDPPADDLVARLAKLDTCAVSDALDQLDIGTGVVTSIRPLTGGRRIAGKALTVELGPPEGGAPGVHLAAAAVAAAKVGDVIVIAHQGRTDCAGWGGNLSRSAQRSGVAGVLVDGAVRDVDEAVAIGFPVFGRGATPRTARGRAREHSWGGEIDVGGVPVDTGDLVIADATGVVFVRAETAGAVLDAAEAIARREAAMAADLADGRPVTEVLGGTYETMLHGDAGPGRPA